jgi:ketosteroid isomerase-like protein
MTSDKERIVQTLRDIFESFQTLDPRAMVPHYHTPCLSIAAEGVTVMATAADVEARFARVMASLKARGYARSDFSDVRVTLLGENIALLSVNGARYKTDGKVLEPLGVTYTLRKYGTAWKVVVLTRHDPDVIVG